MAAMSDSHSDSRPRGPGVDARGEEDGLVEGVGRRVGVGVNFFLASEAGRGDADRLVNNEVDVSGGVDAGSAESESFSSELEWEPLPSESEVLLSSSSSSSSLKRSRPNSASASSES